MKVRFSPKVDVRIRKSKPEGFWEKFSDFTDRHWVFVKFVWPVIVAIIVPFIVVWLMRK